MTRRYYSSDLTNREWKILEPLIPPPKPGGRSVSWERREIVDAILSILRSGCVWRLMPHDFPRLSDSYHYFHLWRIDGTWERVHTRQTPNRLAVEPDEKPPPAPPTRSASRSRRRKKGGPWL